MPIIQVTTTEKLSEENRIVIKTALGEGITTFPGKPEERVMVIFHQEDPIFFGGKPGPAAFVSVTLKGEQPEDTYDTYSKMAVDTILKTLPQIPKERIYVGYYTVEHVGWGKNL